MAVILFVARALLVGCSLLLAVWIETPWPAVLALALVGVSACALTRPAQHAVVRVATIVSWAFTMVVVVVLLVPTLRIWDAYHACLVWCFAGGIGLAAWSVVGSLKIWWQRLTMVWAFMGIVVWLTWAYFQNLAGAFYAGWLGGIALLLLYRWWLRPGPIGIQVANSFILLALFLPLADMFTGLGKKPHVNSQALGNDYSYEAAHGDARIFVNWWRRWAGELNNFGEQCFVPDPGGTLRFRLRPDSNGAFFLSRVHINHRGFRGKEIAEVKGDSYRIVALGESTTFGMTLTPDHCPWTDLLEQMIRERLKPNRPIEVINAGVPMYSLQDNVKRLQTDIIPLRPDLLISYHGWNGFHFFYDALPPVFGSKLPVYRPRPLRLLAECEYRLNIFRCRRLLTTRKALALPPVSNILDTPYCRAYENLADVAARQRIRLVLANYSMAVNSQSPRALMEFYGQAFPTLYRQVKANQLHSLLVQEIARRHSEIVLVDTHAGLDGAHEKFTDPMHFTQEGERQLAETMFEAIRPILEKELQP